MLAQIGLGAAARALLVPFVFLGACGVLLLLALLTLWLMLAGIRAWNIQHDVVAPTFDRQPPAGSSPPSRDRSS